MATRYEVEVKVTSASDLKNVNWRHGPNRPYAVVWVDPDKKVATRVDEEGDTCPRWDQTLVIPLNRPIEDATLHIDIVHAYAEEDTKPLIGSTKLPLKEIIDDVGFGDHATRQLKLKRPSGRPHGKLDIQVSVRETRYREDPYHAPSPYGVRHAPSDYPYAPPPPSSGYPYGAPPSSGYPYGAPPPSGYHYGAPPPSGYPYGAPPPSEYPYGAPQAAGSPYEAPKAAGSPYGGPQAAGYGYGAPQAAGYGYGAPQAGNYGEGEKKKGKFGGMGTGLAVGAVAGALGGLALVEGVDALEDHIADEAAEKVEDDLGVDDGGFDDDDGGW